MATQGLSRLLPLLLLDSPPPPPKKQKDSRAAAQAASSSGHDHLPPQLLPKLERAILHIVRKPPQAQAGRDDGLLGSPHLALTIASLPRLAPQQHTTGDGGVFRSPEFLACVAARAAERAKGMEPWERDMLSEAFRALQQGGGG